jgi:hypothetical protein
MRTIRLTKAQRSAVEIYVVDPAHECEAFAMNPWSVMFPEDARFQEENQPDETA